ncbi:MAG: hypothetical protein ACRC1H_02415, partial [Caldilineaceae bacterium]
MTTQPDAATDRELLTLAAQAAGLEILRWATDDYAIVQDGEAQIGWQPLVFDSDALRLAVTLRISVYHPPSGGCIAISASGEE